GGPATGVDVTTTGAIDDAPLVGGMIAAENRCVMEATGPSVHTTLTRPSASDVPRASLRVPPAGSAVNETATSRTGLSPASSITKAPGCRSAVPTTPL